MGWLCDRLMFDGESMAEEEEVNSSLVFLGIVVGVAIMKSNAKADESI